MVRVVRPHIVPQSPPASVTDLIYEDPTTSMYYLF
jgi:hypothetical protein